MGMGVILLSPNESFRYAIRISSKFTHRKHSPNHNYVHVLPTNMCISPPPSSFQRSQYILKKKEKKPNQPFIRIDSATLIKFKLNPSIGLWHRR